MKALLLIVAPLTLLPACAGELIVIGRDPDAGATDAAPGVLPGLDCAVPDPSGAGSAQAEGWIDGAFFRAQFPMGGFGEYDRCDVVDVGTAGSCWQDKVLILPRAGQPGPAAVGWLHVRTAIEGGDRWFCSEQSAANVSIPSSWSSPSAYEGTFVWSDVHELSCPGAPVALSITVGTLGETTGPGSLDSTPGGGNCGRPVSVITNKSSSCGVINLFLDGDPPSGFLLSSPDDSNPNTLFCIGSIVRSADGSLALEDISIAGQCKDGRPVGDQLEGCFRLP